MLPITWNKKYIWTSNSKNKKDYIHSRTYQCSKITDGKIIYRKTENYEQTCLYSKTSQNLNRENDDSEFF